MLLTNKLPEVYFINNPPHPSALLPKVIRTGAHKLSGLQCVSYHVIHTKSYQGYIASTTLPLPVTKIYQDWGTLVITSTMCELP